MPRGRGKQHTCPTCGKLGRTDFTGVRLSNYDRFFQDVSEKLKHIDSKSQAGIVSTAELSKQVQELRAEQARTRKAIVTTLALILEMLDDKDASAHAKAVVRDFLNTVIPNNK